ncbi:PAS domain S-box protein [Marinobacter hydrocarbonoclasticus]|uniref:PAS domain S-box protein n=1 Tax=Marinobacter nauticus TaxID=2743 RepID=UPI001C98DD30|nr:PAS domain S-box protein [Marinobacter nauticus]MBY6194598.1 PAS domain S-box protein [Marinobacter nauticus]MBY6215746.1 PAS domain S-box protein [Marinobacter nauticus]
MYFRWKTILGIAAIELAFLLLLVWQAAAFIKDLGETEIEKRALNTVTLADSVLRDSLISYDLATIEEHVKQLVSLEGVSYVELERNDRRLAVGGDYPNSEPSVENSISEVTDETYDIAHKMEVAGQTIGVLRIGFSVRELNSLTSAAKTRLYAIAFLELLLVGVCSWLLARYLTNRILLLEKASEKLQAGESIVQIPGNGNDEISSTIRAFNQMAAALAERERALKATNQQLETANNELNEREREVWSLFNAAPDGIAVLDQAGMISFANRRLISLLGSGAASVLGHPLRDFIMPVGGTKLSDAASAMSGGLNTGKSEVVNYAGTTLFVEMNSGVFRSTDSSRTVVIIRDKTHEWQLERAVKLNEQLKANLVDSSLDAFITIDGRGQITDYSQSAEQLFGWKKEEMLGQPMAEYLIPIEFRTAHQKGMAHFLATGEGPLLGKRVETTAIRENGTKFPVELALTATWIDSDVFVSASIRDITERRKRESELIKAKSDAEEASKAKSRFLSYMSHEIRSPMNAVLGALALISEKGKLQNSEQYYLDLARESGDTLLAVVNEILDFSKIEAGHVEFKQQPCELAGLINGVLSAILAKAVKPTVVLSSQIENTVPPVIVTDGERLRQILTILVDNAYKFTEKGEVTVSAELVNLCSDVPSRQLRISVKDTGPGVPAEKVDTIFSEFEQLDAMRDSGFGGTGLGLAIAKRLVSGLNGNIWLESEFGVGSTFIVQIPLLPANEDESDVMEMELPENSDALDHTGSATTQRLLLVDDVEANLVIGAELLKNRGYLVDVAHDGQEAVDKAESTSYSAILMDMRMPRLSGLEATQQIRSSSTHNSRIPIIALTANAEKSEIDRCLAEGMDDFVSKPFNIEGLSRTIEKHLGENMWQEREMHEQNDSADQEQEVLSEEVLAQLVRDTSAESLPMMISVFINEIKKRLEGIERAESTIDESEMREQAHALKSCCGTFGGKKLQAVAHELEIQASQSSACSNEALLANIKQVAQTTLVTYSEYRDQLQSPENAVSKNIQ